MKILFTSSQHASFITQDLNLLRKHFIVDRIITRGVLSPVTVFFHLRRADVTYTWLATVYSFVVVFLARIMKKRSFLLIGGADVARVPEMNYGIWLSRWRKPLVKYALRHATKVLAVDASLKKRAIDLARYAGENIVCLPTGYDPAVWFPKGDKEPSVLTVAKCENLSRMRVKGIDLLFECARLMPGTKFLIIGVAPELVVNSRLQPPPGVEMISSLEQPELLQYYQRAKVYCQPSYIEGLPNSLCEAMLCSCVPVGTDVGGIPTAMGGIGFLVRYGDTQMLADAIRKALLEPESTSQRARDYIAAGFNLEKRELSLQRILGEASQ